MTPDQALAILDQATQPGVRLTRQDCIAVQQALMVLTDLVKKPVPTILPISDIVSP